MALQNIEANITLDLYNHDTTPTTIKAIQLDSETRYVAARLQNMGAQYDVDSGATVQLTVIRPDKVGVQISGTTFTYGDEGAQFLGPYAELTLVALAVSGKLLGQFKITSGTQILRTEIFTISAGVALDASTDEWAGEYDGYNLDELVQTVNDSNAKVDAMEADVTELKSGFTELKEDFKEFSGYTNYALAEGKYYATNGQTVNIDAPSTNSGWKSCVIECTAGDSFYITGQSGSAPRLWCFVDASNSRTSAAVLSVAVASKTGNKLLITAPANATHLVCNFIATQPAELTQGQTLPEVVNAFEADIANAVSVANGVFVKNVPELACIRDVKIYTADFEKVGINYFWYNSPSHTQYETYISIRGYRNGAWENIVGSFSRATKPEDRPDIEKISLGNVCDMLIDWNLISNPFTSTYNDTNRPIFKSYFFADPKAEEEAHILDYESKDTTAHVIHVSADGNGDYTTLTAAYNAIADSDFKNQYEIIVHPGTYQEQYLMPPPYTHTHGIKADETIITSVGLPYYDAISDWASVFQMIATCKLSNMTVISGTKYCIHEDDHRLDSKLIICRNMIFKQTRAHNNNAVGNGTQYGGTKYIFNNCTFINGTVTTHTNTRTDAGANQNTVLESCKFIDSYIIISSVNASEASAQGIYTLEVNNCRFVEGIQSVLLRIGAPISGSNKPNFPWTLCGSGNQNFGIKFDASHDTRFNDCWDAVNTIEKTYVKASETITKGQYVDASGNVVSSDDAFGIAVDDAVSGDYVPVWTGILFPTQTT